MLVATQNMGRLRYSYGKDIADSMIASFGTKVAFNNEDYETREFISKEFGTDRCVVEYPGSRRQGMPHVLMDERVIDDHDLRQLGIGEAIIKTSGRKPHKFAFKPFERERGKAT